jgi:hypothetical protein
MKESVTSLAKPAKKELVSSRVFDARRGVRFRAFTDPSRQE